ncbi:MAG TPA: cysteine desulfurase [Trueperaceae bacterium]|nr:cysteine desulfurase [Trueperaceae bacterium]
MQPLDPRALRRDFPILERTVNGRPLVYLDSAASSQKPRQMVEAMVDYYYHHHANVHRGAHTLSVEATELYENARARLARFMGAPGPEGVVFTRNTTEALNLIAASWGGANLREGDEIVVSAAEHHANLVPWHFLKRRLGVRVKAVPLTPDHRLDLEALEAAIGERTRAVATFHMSNVLGTINPLRRIADMAHAAGAVMIVDGAQGAPHLPVDVQAFDCDFYAVSGHKMLGPTGIGAFWGRPEILEAMPPFLGGGEMIRKVTLEDSTYAGIPARFEAGTPPIAEAVGLAAAIAYLEAVGMEAVAAHDAALARYALERLDGIDGLTLYGPRGEDRGGIVTFNLEGVHPHDVASALDAEGIAIRSGHHCAQPLGAALGASATARASFYLYTTEEEVDRLAEGLVKARDFFKAFA